MRSQTCTERISAPFAASRSRKGMAVHTSSGSRSPAVAGGSLRYCRVGSRRSPGISDYPLIGKPAQYSAQACCETWWNADKFRYVAGQEGRNRGNRTGKEKRHDYRKMAPLRIWGNVVLINERPGAVGTYLLILYANQVFVFF